MMHTREISVHSNTIKGRPTDAIGFLPLHFTSGSCLQYLVAPKVSELAIPGKPASPVNRARIATDTMEQSISASDIFRKMRCEDPWIISHCQHCNCQVRLLMADVWSKGFLLGKRIICSCRTSRLDVQKYGSWQFRG